MIHNDEAEQSVLGAILLDGTLMVKSKLKIEFFQSHCHQKIFAAIAKIHDHSEPITLVTVTKELGKDIQTVGGVGYLSKLAAAVPTLETFEQQQQLVLEAVCSRRFNNNHP
ncbi:DnaB-like helicase N-terminal domain-containing protein [Thalassobacillus devorans]|uniref:DnaB-like helicase N-terminal domain-containing protein n=1 Tax=Thalassobacillus devorans TaxID=279813 RepID=UPI00048B7E06|nr:DnaB-like helicase N-terminal domain-containing protein [Thalassobacillus devorans]